MGKLKDLIEFLESAHDITGEISRKLNKIQEQYNLNYNNAESVRTSEIEFLQKEFFADNSRFPEEVVKKYNDNLPGHTVKFDKNIADLLLKRDELKKEIAMINSEKTINFDSMKKFNSKLDKKEEELKERVKKTQFKISDYNKRIDEINTGFGFITNFFKMKSIEKDKNKLLERRDKLVDQIEDIRKSWIEKSGEKETVDKEIQEMWNYSQTEYSIINEKIKNLTERRESLINRAAFKETLDSLYGNEKYLTSGITVKKFDKCSKCKSINTDSIFYCSYCGEPFDKNREDIAGSLIETGELNKIHKNLTEGIKGTVSFIALIRGIRDGIKTFLKSVKEVKSSQDQYSQLPSLKIDVPAFSMNFKQKISELNSAIDKEYFNLHPTELALKLKNDTDNILNQSNIEKFFSLMGDELNKTTKEQW